MIKKKVIQNGIKHFNIDHNDELCPECKKRAIDFEIKGFFCFTKRLIYKCHTCDCIWVYKNSFLKRK